MPQAQKQGSLLLSAGESKPYGSKRTSEGVNFAIYSRLATDVTLCLFNYESGSLYQEIHLDPEIHKTGHVWHVHVGNLPHNLCYAYRFNKGIGKVFNKYYDSERLIIDPYAKGLATPVQWGEGLGETPLGLVDQAIPFDWEGDKPLNLPREELVIYEMHVRGFTVHSSSKVEVPGSFLGVIDKIPYLKELGVNAVKLMPIQEFNEIEYQRFNPLNGEKLYNFWGYSPLHYFSPMNRYASSKEFGQSLIDFKMMVKELHRNGIEVILDIVLNHTGENEESIFSFLGIDPSTYYLFDNEHEMVDFTGCGNTVNSNHPIVRDFIKDCLRYWVSEMHVDGFRFDLAAVMFRGVHGEPLKNPPLIEALSNDPILAFTKLIAEPWDAAGLYRLGHFYSKEERWSEWNDVYRDEVRQFIKGDKGRRRGFATRLCGSDDIFGRERTPVSTINFISAHDGFTLHDLVSYNQKDNTANGENNRDGHPANYSWNCGEEGRTDNPEVAALRLRQMKNFHLTLLLSQGVPMLLMGNEYGHTRHGNNNSWCQDNELNWFLWDETANNPGFFRFYQRCIDFRKRHPILRRNRYLTPDDIQWHGKVPWEPDWDGDTKFLAYLQVDEVQGQHLFVAFNPSAIEKHIVLPDAENGKKWFRAIDTFMNSPDDFLDEEEMVPLHENSYSLKPYSVVVFKLKQV